MSVSFRPATRHGCGLFIAAAGPSRSGKTLSGLMMAKGIAGKTGKIAAIDTEARRMSHYSDRFKFDVCNLQSPFSPSLFSAKALEAQNDGYAALFTDSFSHEWSGRGGVLALYDEYFAKTGFKENMKDVCWARAKKDHKLMKDDLIQLTIPIIFGLRAKEVAPHLCTPQMKLDKRSGWKVDQDQSFLFEWTVGLFFHPDTPGKPRFDLVDTFGRPLWKMNDDHRPLFPEGQFVTEEAGRALQEWRMSESAANAGSQAVSSIAGQMHDDDDEQPPVREEHPGALPDALRIRLDNVAGSLLDAVEARQPISTIDTLQAKARGLMAELEDGGYAEAKTALVEAFVSARNALAEA